MTIEDDNRLKGYVFSALLAGTAAAGGYLLIAVPNVEVFTSILFVAGYVVGMKRGLVTALIASVLYFGLNPQGGIFPPVLAAQIIGVAAAPCAGVMFRHVSRWNLWNRILVACAGAVITIWFDLLTNLAFPLAAGFDFESTMVTLTLGIPFALVHLSSNVLIFFILAPMLLSLAARHRLSG